MRQKEMDGIGIGKGLVYRPELITAYWWQDVANWGDQLTPLLLKRFSHLDTTWAAPDRPRPATVAAAAQNWRKSLRV